MRVKRRQKVKGVKAGNMPGYARTYECTSCKKQKKTIEIDPALLVDLQNQFEEQRREWIAETAALKQKIYYLTLPDRLGTEKIKRIRKKLFELLECTA